MSDITHPSLNSLFIFISSTLSYRSISIKLENCKYNHILVWFNKIFKICLQGIVSPCSHPPHTSPSHYIPKKASITICRFCLSYQIPLTTRHHLAWVPSHIIQPSACNVRGHDRCAQPPRAITCTVAPNTSRGGTRRSPWFRFLILNVLHILIWTCFTFLESEYTI